MNEDEKDAVELQVRKVIESGRLNFDYIKSNYFRVIHCDGVWGGISPKLTIQMAVFSERNAIPTQTVQEVKADGAIGEELLERRTVRDAIIREVEANIVMDLQTAKVIVGWLQGKVNQIEALVNGQTAKKDA